MSNPYETLARLILPDGLLDYFEITNIVQSPTGQLDIHLEEKNLPPAGYEKSHLESKGFLPETAIQDFPIRGHKVALCIKRRRWEVKASGEIITRDWDFSKERSANDNGIRHFFKRYIWIITRSAVIC